MKGLWKVSLLSLLIVLVSCNEKKDAEGGSSNSSGSNNDLAITPGPSAPPAPPTVTPPSAPSPTPCDPDEELIENGSFETGHGLTGNSWNVFAEIDGWFADLDAIDAPIEIQHGHHIGGIAPSHGDAKLELDSHPRNGFTKSDAHVNQIIDVEENTEYILRFDYSPRIKRNPKTNIVEVFWNDQKIAHLNHFRKGWETYELVVYSDDFAESELSFRGKRDRNTVGGYIDNVSLKEKCE